MGAKTTFRCFSSRRLPVEVVMQNLLGLTLAEAQTACAGREVKVIETAPPFTPRHYIPVWGEWRVLRAKEQNDSIELLVARELLREEKIVRDPEASNS